MAEQPERLGQQVGEYRLLRQLGKGSFGAVYLAEHLHDHSQMAIKLLQLQLTSRKDLKDFLNEARTIRLRHPHIVPLLDFGLSRDDIPFLVMEYAAGGTLRQHYPKGTKLPLETIDTYVTQLASALQYAHEHHHENHIQIFLIHWKYPLMTRHEYPYLHSLHALPRYRQR